MKKRGQLPTYYPVFLNISNKDYVEMVRELFQLNIKQQ